MAQRGGAARREAAFASELNARRFQDQYRPSLAANNNDQYAASLAANDNDQYTSSLAANDNDAYGDLADSSDLSQTQRSPLELPPRSYTTEGEEDEEGLPSTVMELERQRTKEAKMRETAEQFVGAPAIPGPSEEGAEAEGRGQATRQPEATAGPEGTSPEESDVQQPGVYQRIRDRLRSEERSTPLVGGGDEVEELAVKSAWDSAKAATSETLIVPMIIQDIQLVNQIAFKSKAVPELRFFEIVELIFLHIFVAIVVIIIVGFLYGLISAILHALGTII